MKQPRPEYPRPHFSRAEDTWQNLNGEWDFEIDYGQSGEAQGFWTKPYSQKLQVPFCPESKLSGIGNTDFMESVWYRRKLCLPKEWAGKRILLNFGAVDYFCKVRLDDKPIGSHAGGSSSFSFDISAAAKPGEEQTLVVHARDCIRRGDQPSGKQSVAYASSGCTYTRVTGIWQTVWVEAVDAGALERCVITPDIDAEEVLLRPFFYEQPGKAFSEKRLRVTIEGAGERLAEQVFPAKSGRELKLSLPKPTLWEPKNPFLYDVFLEVLDSEGRVVDAVRSYVGMRSFTIKGNKFYLNNKPFYVRWVLDQGFYPDGIWTAPSDAELKADIERSLAAGFNGARLHQKVFEERFHYWADKLGYLTSAEFPTWGCDLYREVDQYRFLYEWRACIERDQSHPSIVMWTALNECGWGKSNDERLQAGYCQFVREVEKITEALDPSRIFHDASGGVHVGIPAIQSVHFYTPDALMLMERVHWAGREAYCVQFPEVEMPYQGQPYFVDEWGGLKYLPKELLTEDTPEGWGYQGDEIQSAEAYCERIREQVQAMADDGEIAGWCFTQLTDVEQEQNGVFSYARAPKAPLEALSKAFAAKPEWAAYD